MDPRLLTEVEIPEAWRGYNRDAVDDLLEQAASALGELQARFQEAAERASNAERRLLERSDEDELRRTLVLAQRTSAAAVEEAKAEAERIVTEAKREARRISIEAEARVANLEGDLAQQRTALQADVDGLAAFVDDYRSRLKAELERQIEALDSPGLQVPEAPTAHAAWPTPEPPTPEPESFVSRSRTDDAPAAGDEVLAPEEESGDEPNDAPPAFYDAADESGEIEVAAAPEVAWKEPVADEPDDDDDGGDPFLAELRRAVTDTEPLGPRDDNEASMLFAPDDDAVPSGRFRLRRGR